jgi:Tol biopolymer transport system component
LGWSLLVASASLAIVAISVISSVRQPWRPDISRYRFVPFATEDAAESFPVWSPDGRSIAYTVGSERVGPAYVDLMVKGVDSDSPVRIAQGPGIISPAWSGDASRVYYLGRSGPRARFDIMSVARAGGVPAQVFTPAAREGKGFHAIAVTLDGSTLAVIGVDIAKAVRRVWLSSPPGAPLQAIPNFEGACCSVPSWIAWSPEGTELLAAITGSGNSDVWKISRSGAATKVFSETGLATVAHTVAWTPAARHAVIAGTRTREIKLVDVASATATTLLPSLDVTEAFVSAHGRIAITRGESRQYLIELPLDGSPPRPWLSSRLDQHSPSWSPVRDELVYVRESEIRVRARDGSFDRVIVSKRDFPDVTAPLQFLAPAISPDGSRVAYTVVGMAREGIYISPVAGGPPARLGDDSGRRYWPSWSPDGAWVAYASYDSVPSRLAKIHAGSNAQADLPLPGCAPEWSHDGRWILCSHAGRLRIVSSDGKQNRTFGENMPAATWSRDGKVLYAIRTGANRELVAIQVDSGATRTISVIPADIALFSGNSPVWRPSLSRDGKTLLTTANRVDSDIFILDGFEPPRSFWATVWGRVR